MHKYVTDRDSPGSWSLKWCVCCSCTCTVQICIQSNMQVNFMTEKVSNKSCLKTVNNDIQKDKKAVYIFQFLSILLNLFSQLSVHSSGRLQTCPAVFSLTDT